MSKTNWSEWIPYDGSGQPVADDVPVQVITMATVYNIIKNAEQWDWDIESCNTDIIHYRYDLDHLDDPKPTLPVTPEEDAAWNEKRADTIGHNGPTGEHYPSAMQPFVDAGQPQDNRSDGSTASYYQLPEGATELQHLISHRDMNAQIGEIFRSCYRYGQASHSDKLRDARKIKFYIDAEIARLEAL